MNEEDNARLDERKTKEEKKTKTKTNKKKKKEEEEEQYNKTKLSMLGRSVFERALQEMSKLKRENVQNQQKR